MWPLAIGIWPLGGDGKQAVGEGHYKIVRKQGVLGYQQWIGSLQQWLSYKQCPAAHKSCPPVWRGKPNLVQNQARMQSLLQTSRTEMPALRLPMQPQLRHFVHNVMLSSVTQSQDIFHPVLRISHGCVLKEAPCPSLLPSSFPLSLVEEPLRSQTW